MEYKNKVSVVNTMIGSGKTSAAINYINSSTEDERFIVITSCPSEVERYWRECPEKNFEKLCNENGNSKGLRKNVENLRIQIENGNNIVTSHTFLQEFDKDIMTMCEEKNYTLILDEITNIIKKHPTTKSDLRILQEFMNIDNVTGLMSWKEDQSDYTGVFINYKRLYDIGACTYYDEKYSFMWLFPTKVINCFHRVFILTYMFEVQPQKYYYDYSGLDYSFIGITYENEKYQFSENPAQKFSLNADLIHVLESANMNCVGDSSKSLSQAWFQKNKDSLDMKQLKRNISNFFRHVRDTKSNDVIWTTFGRAEDLLKGGGYSKGYITLGSRATNDYQDRTSVAYIANCYMDPLAKRFFKVHKIEVDEDKYALSEMLQFIWRSAIRCGNEIWVYVPSARMRTLLENWIEENSK